MRIHVCREHVCTFYERGEENRHLTDRAKSTEMFIILKYNIQNIVSSLNGS